MDSSTQMGNTVDSNGSKRKRQDEDDQMEPESNKSVSASSRHKKRPKLSEEDSIMIQSDSEGEVNTNTNFLRVHSPSIVLQRSPGRQGLLSPRGGRSLLSALSSQPQPEEESQTPPVDDEVNQSVHADKVPISLNDRRLSDVLKHHLFDSNLLSASDLIHARSVCHRWRNLIGLPCVEVNSHRLTSNKLATLVQKTTSVTCVLPHVDAQSRVMSRFLSSPILTLPSSKITRVSFSRSQIATESYELLLLALAKDTKIKDLDLSYTRLHFELAEALGSMISQNTTIERLSLRGNDASGVAKSYATALVSNNRTLLELNLRECNYWQDDDIDAIITLVKESKTLRSLDLKSALSPDEERAKQFGEALERNTTLTSLVLSKGLDGGPETFVSYLVHNRGLKKLSLHHLSDLNSVLMVQEVIQSNTSLEDLEILNLDVDEGIMPIVEALKHNTTLVALNLSRSHCIDEDILQLSESIAVNTTLRSLTMGRLARGASMGLAAFFWAIRSNRSLRCLNFSSYTIEDAQGIALSNALATETLQLSRLILHRCCLGNEFVKIICRGLEQNASLIHLDLSCNLLTDGCVESLVGVIRKHKCLTVLHLQHNRLSDDGAYDIAEAISTSQSLNLVSLAANRHMSNAQLIALAAAHPQISIWSLRERKNHYCSSDNSSSSDSSDGESSDIDSGDESRESDSNRVDSNDDYGWNDAMDDIGDFVQVIDLVDDEDQD